MKCLKLEFIYKNHDTSRYVTFLYTKMQTLRKKQDNLCYVLIYKIRTLYVTRFLLNSWNWRREGVAFLYAKSNAFCVTLYLQKTMHYALRFYIQKPRHFALHYYMQKTIHFALRCYI